MSAADHPLATAAARAGFGTDVVLSCDALGERVDARIAALAALGEPTGAARDEIKAALAEFGRAAGSVSGGEHPAFWTWSRGALGAIARHARRLFPGESWVQDIRPPAWRPT